MSRVSKYGTVTTDGVRVEKTHSKRENELAVTLEFRSEREEPVVVRFEDELPTDGRPAGAGEGDGRNTDGSAFRGGHIDGTLALTDDGEVAVTYLVSVPEETVSFLSDDEPSLPRIVEVTPVEPQSSTTVETRAEWRAPSGERMPLSVTVSDGHSLPSQASVDGIRVIDISSSGESDRLDAVADTDRPAIGIIARAEDDDGVYRTILEARKRGFGVFLAPFGYGTEELVEIADTLGVRVVDPPEEDSGWRTLQSALSAAAREAGHPGIVFQPEGCPRIDYDRTLAAFAEDGFEIHAVPERPDITPGRPHVLVAIPAYNAAGSIGSVVSEARRFADEVVVVDDGSTDGTADRAREAGAAVVVHPRNRGYGGALKTIFREAHRRGAAHLVTIDADGQHDPGDIPRLVATQDDSGAGVVIASRYGTDSDTDIPFVRSVGLAVVNLLTNVTMGRWRRSRQVQDTQSGFRSYTADAVETVVDSTDIGNGMWASTDILYSVNEAGFDFHEIGTTIRYDVEHGSTEGAATHGVGLVHNIVDFVQRSHPILLVGAPGVMVVLLGALLAAWSLQLQLSGELSIPLVVVASISIAVGAVMLTLSVLLHVLNTHPFFDDERWQDRRE
ncbi:glycosyltransferase family 2 protein [Natronomonas gomsonensis]|uniref:glycosyltransferase n=1 Tax=Natronomonas gomsonensis TaxID=1046043 RepID=UPI0015BDFBBD